MNKKLLLLALTLLSFWPAFSQNVPPAGQLTLQEAIKFALSNNENIKKAALDEQSAEYKIKETKGSGLPQVSGTGQLNTFPALATQLLPGELAGQPGTLIPVQFGTKYNVSGGLELQQLLFSKSFFVGLEAANTTRELYALRKQLSEEQIIYNVGSAYLQMLQTKEQFNTIDANTKRLEQLEKILTLQYKNDVATKVQVNRVTVSKTNLENQRQTLTAAYDQQKNALKFFMGLPMNQDIQLADSANVLDEAVPVQDDANAILADRIDFKLLTTQKSLYKLNVKNIQSRYYPSLSGFGNFSTNAQRNEFNFFDNSQPWFKAVTLGIRLNIPIFDGFQRRNQMRQAQIEVDKVDQDIQLLTRNTQMELLNANTQMKTSLSSIRAQERNVELAQEVYRNTNELYKEGLSPLTELLDTEVSLREAQTNLNNERLKYQLAQLTYLQAKGNLRTLIK
ncbi:TolC family protein [Adhaeribacter rhizoryzae]|uniref:TolC family protein n=1 Tax=Adhaeribacter rhizoryzae TaxID=2607907 RepID=UPI001CC20255|nr:TolC family protein [Adhaeribacter rhizoryzae]